MRLRRVKATVTLILICALPEQKANGLQTSGWPGAAQCWQAMMRTAQTLQQKRIARWPCTRGEVEVAGTRLSQEGDVSYSVKMASDKVPTDPGFHSRGIRILCRTRRVD